MKGNNPDITRYVRCFENLPLARNIKEFAIIYSHHTTDWTHFQVSICILFVITVNNVNEEIKLFEDAEQ